MDDRHATYRQAILDGLAQAETILERDGLALVGIKAMAKAIDDLPRWIRGDVVETLEIGEMEAGRYIADLIETCSELDHLRSWPIEVAWWTSARTRSGGVLLGTAQAIGARERELYAGPDAAPWFRVSLSMPYWLLADGMERYRLLHHELMHCDVVVGTNGEIVGPTTRPHDVEEFAATVGRFGVEFAAQAALVAAAAHHPAKLKQYAVDAQGQGLLFGPWDGPPKDLADGDVIEMRKGA